MPVFELQSCVGNYSELYAGIKNTNVVNQQQVRPCYVAFMQVTENTSGLFYFIIFYLNIL